MTDSIPPFFKVFTAAELMANPPAPWTESDYSVYGKKDKGFEGAWCLGTWQDSGAKFVLWLREDLLGVLIERYNAYPNDKQPAEYMHIHIESLRMVMDKLQTALKYEPSPR